MTIYFPGTYINVHLFPYLDAGEWVVGLPGQALGAHSLGYQVTSPTLLTFLLYMYIYTYVHKNRWTLMIVPGK